MGQGGPIRGGTGRGDVAARIRLDLSELRNAPGLARQYARATAREIEQSFRQTQRAQIEGERQRMAEMQAALQQRKVAVRAAAREEAQVQRQAQREQALAERQRMTEMRAALQQRRIAVRAAAREEMEIQRQVAAQQKALAQQQAAEQQRILAQQMAAAGRRQALTQGAASFAGAALGGPVGGIAGALVGGSAAIPLAAGLGVAAVGRAAVAGEQLATSYRRQQIAAVNLAGSQSRLNELLRAYQQATGGAIGRAQSLADTTRLMAVGFADTAQELTRFTIASRGAAIAMGETQDRILSELQLALSNTSFQRLDQIGLSVEEVQQRMDELRESSRGLSREAAFQESVLSLLEEKYGALASSAEGQASGTESLRRAWADLGLEWGELVRGPVDKLAEALADMTDASTKGVRGLAKAFDDLGVAMRRASGGYGPQGRLRSIESVAIAAPTPEPMLGERLATRRQEIYAEISNLQQAIAAAEASGRAGMGAQIQRLYGNLEAANRELARVTAEWGMATGRVPLPPGLGVPTLRPPGAPSPGVATGTTERFKPEQMAVISEWALSVREIERSANRQRLDTTQQYEEQRSSVIAAYGKQMSRDAEDFARQRANAERRHSLAILDVHEEAAHQRATWERDLNRRIDEMQADSAEKRAEWETEREERIAEVRADSRDRLARMDEEFHRDQARAQKRHRDNLLVAAARLDAFALWEERRRWAREQQEAREDHAKRVDDEREAEQKRLDEINEAHEKRLQAERRSLDKSTRQAQEAHQRQLADQAEATQRRLEQMQKAFEEQREQEDVERSIRLGRQAQDHQEQLGQMDRQHAARLAQIDRQAVEERQALNEAFEAQLAELELYTDRWESLQKRRQDEALELFDEWWDEINKKIKPAWERPERVAPDDSGIPAFASGGFVARTGPAFLHAGEYVLNPSTTRAVSAAMGGINQPGLVGAVAGAAHGPVTVNMVINASPEHDERLIGDIVHRRLSQFFQQAGRF